MTDLAEVTATARRLFADALPDGYVLTIARAATCHPDRPAISRGLCQDCKTPRYRAREFVAEYELLSSEGYTRNQIADRLRITRSAVDQAYLRAVRNGLLTPDRRAA